MKPKAYCNTLQTSSRNTKRVGLKQSPSPEPSSHQKNYFVRRKGNKVWPREVRSPPKRLTRVTGRLRPRGQGPEGPASPHTKLQRFWQKPKISRKRDRT